MRPSRLRTAAEGSLALSWELRLEQEQQQEHEQQQLEERISPTELPNGHERRGRGEVESRRDRVEF